MVADMDAPRTHRRRVHNPLFDVDLQLRCENHHLYARGAKACTREESWVAAMA